MGIFRKKLKVGQIWRMRESDPFRMSGIHRRIIDIKNGYILYYSYWADKDSILPDVGEESCKKHEFRFFYNELVKDVEDR